VGNRSRFVAMSATAAAAVALAARRRRRRAAAFGIRDAILPTHGLDAPSEWDAPPDAGHAPGHRHLSRYEPRGASPRRGWRRHGYQPYERD
jgi:hypothetical protein